MTTPDEPQIILEIEQNALGALMIGGQAKETLAFLREYHFVEGFHQQIFRAIMTAYEKYGKANPVIVKQLLGKSAEAFELNSGSKVSDYLAHLASNATSTGSMSVENARSVIRQWARISIGAAGSKASARASDPSCDINSVIHETSGIFEDVMAETRFGKHGKSRISLGNAVGMAIESAMEAKDSGNGITGVTWGLADLNRLTGGIQRRDLTLIGARPSMGKTSFALSVAIKAAKAGNGVGFFSLEMDSEKLAARAISDFLYDWGKKIPYVEILRGNVSEDEINLMADARVQVDELPIIIDDQSRPTVADIRIRTERMMEEAERAGKPITLIMVDHLGLMKPSSHYVGNRTNEIGEMTAGLKGLARDLDIAVILLSQLSRAVESRENKVPVLSDLRDSGSIEQDADMIGFLYREAYYLGRESGGSFEQQADREERLEQVANDLELHIAKQRNGPIAKVDLFADMGFSAVRNGVRK